MPSAPCNFRETEVARAIRSAKRGGLEVDSVSVTKDGTITIHSAKPEAAKPEAAKPALEQSTKDEARPNSFDKVLGA
jgi:hypothetical protein